MRPSCDARARAKARATAYADARAWRADVAAERTVRLHRETRDRSGAASRPAIRPVAGRRLQPRRARRAHGHAHASGVSDSGPIRRHRILRTRLLLCQVAPDADDQLDSRPQAEWDRAER